MIPDWLMHDRTNQIAGRSVSDFGNLTPRYIRSTLDINGLCGIEWMNRVYYAMYTDASSIDINPTGGLKAMIRLTPPSRWLPQKTPWQKKPKRLAVAITSVLFVISLKSWDFCSPQRRMMKQVKRIFNSRINHLVEIEHGMLLKLVGTNAKNGVRSRKWRILLLQTCTPSWFEIAAEEGNLSELDMMVYYILRRNPIVLESTTKLALLISESRTRKIWAREGGRCL